MQNPSPTRPSRSHRRNRLGALVGLGCLGLASVVFAVVPASAWPSAAAASAEIRDVVVTNTSFAPGVQNRFSGTATPGATLRVGFLTGWQQSPEDITVRADGTWSFDHTPPAGLSSLLMRFTQQVGGTERVSQIFTLAPGAGTPTPEDPTAPRDVTLQNTTFIPGMANRFSGTATPGATLRVGFLTGWQSHPHDIPVGADGTWSFDHTPPAGSESLLMRFSQRVDGVERVSPVFTLTAGAGTPAPEVPAELADPAVVTERVQAGGKRRIDGTATPGAYLTVLDPDGRTMVPGETRVGDDGSWSFEVDVPSTDDTFAFRLAQELGDRRAVSGVLTVHVDGATPPVGRPEFVAPTVDDTSFVPGVANRFTGTATPGATLRVGFTTGWQSHPFDIPVAADGTWSFDHTPPAGETTLQFRFSQTLGDETRVSELFTLAAGPGTPAPNDPQELTAPTVVSGPVRAGTTARIAGTATPGAHVRILDVDGRQVVPGDLRVGDDGTWSAEVAVPTTASTFVFRVEQFLGALHGVSDPLSVDVEGATPADGEAGVVAPTLENSTFRPGVENHFAGTATPGATMHVEFLNGWQSHDQVIPVAADGTWSFDHTVPADLYSLHLRFVQTVDGQDTTSKVFSLTRS
ncbi:hypothetical protein GCM10009706_04080 [Curtobacterium citreum]|uniref:Bacterial Ig domain-containing protein n=1 Tax=Curtobacterium citreum TaxID=2036 RepID=A0ABT2HI82_9MICO|nr:hypothetical protein [Curtobacterium citreum]MCS6522988.1 hypothetical protein [Curtobacterium citreum]TQJ28896.1 hypothetical protein FB462_2800 [Curtobacterium citreum]GGL68889.1 hypothetical protein GCM10009706_04080 [Curtobacterium citreum]